MPEPTMGMYPKPEELNVSRQEAGNSPKLLAVISEFGVELTFIHPNHGFFHEKDMSLTSY